MQDMASSEHPLKRELDDAEELIQPVFLPIKSGTEKIFENSIIKGNVETTETRGDMVGGEFGKKVNITNTAALPASSFIPTKAESDFKETSGEKVMEGDSQASKMTEDWYSQAGISVKEEPIDCEETWQEYIKLESTSPLSMNTIEDVVKEKSEELTSPCSIKEEKHDICRENNRQPHLNYSPLACSSQFVSSTEFLSEDEQSDAQKHFERFSCSSSSTTVRLRSFGSKNVLPAASSSTDNHSVGEEKAADTYLWKKEVEQQVAGEEQKQQSGQFGDRISTNHEETHSEIETKQFGSLARSTNEGFFKCNYCGKAFKKKYCLSTHIQTHTGIRLYKCSQCGKSFIVNGHLTRHMRKHTGHRPYKCSQCGKSFIYVDHLTRHMRKHTGDRPYKCSQCGKSFIYVDHLTRHMRKHTGDRPYKCSQCGKSFIDGDHLTRHMRKHTGDRPYKCSQCGKSFIDGDHLTRHMRKHTGDRPYKCSQCGKSFTESGSLTNHLRTHSGDRPYKCSQCGESFRYSVSLTRHMYSHTGARPYKCSECGESFTQNSHLTRHMRKHTGDRPYKCSQCSKSFMRNSSLSKHMHKHTAKQHFN